MRGMEECWTWVYLKYLQFFPNWKSAHSYITSGKQVKRESKYTTLEVYLQVKMKEDKLKFLPLCCQTFEKPQSVLGKVANILTELKITF